MPDDEKIIIYDYIYDAVKKAVNVNAQMHDSCHKISELINVELPCLINRILLTAKYGCNCNEETMNAIRDNLKKISNDMIDMALDKDMKKEGLNEQLHERTRFKITTYHSLHFSRQFNAYMRHATYHKQMARRYRAK